MPLRRHPHKKWLLEKQKEGKKRTREYGSAQIPQGGVQRDASQMRMKDIESGEGGFSTSVRFDLRR
jgi:hypothetical protein